MRATKSYLLSSRDPSMISAALYHNYSVGDYRVGAGKVG